MLWKQAMCISGRSAFQVEEITSREDLRRILPRISEQQQGGQCGWKGIYKGDKKYQRSVIIGGVSGNADPGR